METFDIVVIGAGPGGYPAAIRAAQLGAKVAVIEKEFFGGTCLNWGCIPTKTLIASSSIYNKMKHAGEFGINAGEPGYDYPAMIRRKDDVVAKLRGGIESLLKGHGVKIIKGTASFADKKKINVTNSEGTTAVEARNIVLATGSVSAVPGFIPKHDRIVESKKFLEWTILPKNIIVLGGGVIGCEFACMAAQLGSNVTIVEMLEDILFILDADVRREVRRYMETKLNIKVLTGKPLTDIKADASGVGGAFGDQTLHAEALLVAIGRKPYTEGLDLAKAGLETTKTGHIEVDQFCQTKVPGIFAIGDIVAGSPQLAHAATAQGITAVENALTTKRMKAMEVTVPACIFTDPEIGCVGLTEQKAKELGKNVVTGKFMFGGLGKAMASGETTGFVKWIADPETDQLLGAQCVGAHATELISEAAIAIRAELSVRELGRTVHCHPTMSESWMEAAHAVHGECIHAPPKRKK